LREKPVFGNHHPKASVTGISLRIDEGSFGQRQRQIGKALVIECEDDSTVDVTVTDLARQWLFATRPSKLSL
jgi:hypothetical protein